MQALSTYEAVKYLVKSDDEVHAFDEYTLLVFRH